MKVLKGILNVFLIIIAVALSISIYGIEIGMHTVYSTKDYLTVDGIRETIKNVDLGSYLADVDSDGDEVLNDFYEIMNENGFDNELAKEIINSKEIKEVVGNYISSSIDAILNDGDVKKPTVDEIMSIIENNNLLLEKLAEAEGVTLTEEVKQEYLSSLKESVPELIKQIPDIKEEMGEDITDVRNALNIISTVFSPLVLLSLFIAITIIYLLISLLRWSFHKAMLYLAIPTILSSITVIKLATSLGIIKSALELDEDLYNFLDKTIFSSLGTKLLISGLIGLVIGIGLIVGYVLIKRIPKKETITLE